jgi:2-hydroxychromene-2-carboxylate isomerase
VPSYLVETYLARGQASERADRERRARSAAEELAREHTSVCFERSIHVPEDEICFCVFEAAGAGDAALAAQRASLDPIRVVEAVSSGKEEEK